MEDRACVLPDIQSDKVSRLQPTGNNRLTTHIDVQFTGEQTGVRQTVGIVQVFGFNSQKASIYMQNIIWGLNVALNTHAVGVQERLVPPAGHTGGVIAQVAGHFYRLGDFYVP